MSFASPIKLIDLELTLPEHIAFEGFNQTVFYGQRIAIIGRNGSGKSSLLKAIAHQESLVDGVIDYPQEICIAYVPQFISSPPSVSGAERFMICFYEALAQSPNLLLLDEPTNHLDLARREELFNALSDYEGALILVSHDVNLLQCCTDSLWHIREGKIDCFAGYYLHYIADNQRSQLELINKKNHLQKEIKASHQSLMKAQKVAAQKKKQGQKHSKQNKWAKVVANTKASKSQETSANQKQRLEKKKQKISSELKALYLPTSIKPTFTLKETKRVRRVLCSVRTGSVYYENQSPLLENISFSVESGERIALVGNNASGKSTFIRALIGHQNISITGEWLRLNSDSIGYFDQFYSRLDDSLTVYQTIAQHVSMWSSKDIRYYLSQYLFKTNEEVNREVIHLSGGEKVRLFLASICISPKELLILDEITNNVDLETRPHFIEALREFKGALLIISHDRDFLDKVGIDKYLLIKDKKLIYKPTI